MVREVSELLLQPSDSCRNSCARYGPGSCFQTWRNREEEEKQRNRAHWKLFCGNVRSWNKFPPLRSAVGRAQGELCHLFASLCAQEDTPVQMAGGALTMQPCSLIQLWEQFLTQLLTACVTVSAQVSQSLQLLEMSTSVLYEMRIRDLLSAHIFADVWGSHQSGMYLECYPLPKLQSYKKFPALFTPGSFWI